MGILCRLGRHRWRTYYATELSLLQSRECLRCGEQQTQDGPYTWRTDHKGR